MKIGDTVIAKDSQVGRGTIIWEFANVNCADIGDNTKIDSFV